MFKIMFYNELEQPEILFSDRAYIDPTKENDVLIEFYENVIRLRVHFENSADAYVLMKTMFTSNDINIIELCNTDSTIHAFVEPIPTDDFSISNDGDESDEFLNVEHYEDSNDKSDLSDDDWIEIVKATAVLSNVLDSNQINTD